MASRKINWRLAHNISDAIAAKAFEHLIDPARKEYNAAAEKVWKAAIEGLPMELMLARGFLQKSGGVSVNIRSTQDDSETGNLRISYTGPDCYLGYNWETPRVTDDALYAEASLVAERLSGFERKRNAFSTELKAELEGKTTTAAIKAWPEAAQIICEIAEVNNPTAGFTTPLDNMLAKYLPLLAAPQGA